MGDRGVGLRKRIDKRVKDLLIKVDRRLPSCSSSCLFHEVDRRLDSSSLSCLFHKADRRQTQPSLTQPIATPTRRFSPAEGRLTSFSPCLAFLSARSLRKADRKNLHAVSPTADHPTQHSSFLCCLPGACSPRSRLQFFFLFPFGARPFTKPTDSSPSQSTGRRLLRRRRTSRSTTTVRTMNMPPTSPDTHVMSIYRTTWLNMH